MRGGARPRSARTCRAIVVMLGGSVALVGGRLMARTGWRINLSPSAPIGIYRARRLAPASGTALGRGLLVAVCLPRSIARWGRSRHYLGRGSCPDGSAPVGKTIFAVAGDTVGVGPDGLTRNGVPARNTRPLARDTEGRPLPRIGRGQYAVAQGELWLVSTRVARSWDSRYYGSVPVTAVVAELRPVWVLPQLRPSGERPSATRSPA